MTTMYELYDVYDELTKIWQERNHKGDKEFPTNQEILDMVDELRLQKKDVAKIGKPYGSARFWD